MTAAEWDACTDPHAMVVHLRREWDKGVEYYTVTDHQFRLWAAAWWRLFLPHEERHEQRAIDVEAGVFDWRCLVDQLQLDQDYAKEILDKVLALQPVGAQLLRCVVGNPWRPLVLEEVCPRCDGDGEAHGSDRPFEWSPEKGYPGRCPADCIHGRTPPPWLTPSIRATARTIYEGRCWEMLPALADELEEAGCPLAVLCDRCCWGDRCDDSTHYYRPNCPCCGGTGSVPHPLLQHLRNPGPHCRGCHALAACIGEVTK